MDEDFDMPPAEEMMNDDLDLPEESPILKVGEEQEIGKQGLKKKLLKQGQDWETPDNGDEVEGTLLFSESLLYCLFCFWFVTSGFSNSFLRLIFVSFSV